MGDQVLCFGVIFLMTLQMIHGYSQNKYTIDEFSGKRTKILHNFIVDGYRASQGQFPGMVSFRGEFGIHFCGGSILTDDYVITAAHCLFMEKHFQIMAGEVNIIPLDKVKSLHDVVEKHAHPEYPKNSLFDLGLVKVKPRFNFTSFIKPYPMINYEVVPYDKCQLCGWGQTWKPELLKAGQGEVLAYMNTKVLQVVKKPARLISAADTVASACSGDSGGGLICNGKLAGVISGGKKNCQGHAVYVSTYHYFKWIERYAELPDMIPARPHTQPETSGVQSYKQTQFLFLFIRVLSSFCIYTYFLSIK